MIGSEALPEHSCWCAAQMGATSCGARRSPRTNGLEPLAEVEGALLVVEVLHAPHPELGGLLLVVGGEHFLHSKDSGVSCLCQHCRPKSHHVITTLPRTPDPKHFLAPTAPAGWHPVPTAARALSLPAVGRRRRCGPAAAARSRGPGTGPPSNEVCAELRSARIRPRSRLLHRAPCCSAARPAAAAGPAPCAPDPRPNTHTWRHPHFV